MQVTISEKDANNVVTLSFETAPGRAKVAYEKTLRKFGEQVNIKGFRKGKVPLKIVEEYVGAEAVKAETINNQFLSELFEEVFKAKELNVVFVSNIEKVDFPDPDSAVSVLAKVELFPEVTLPDMSKVTLDVKIPRLEFDKQKQETLDRIQLNYSEYKETNDKALAWDDEIVFDFDGEYKDPDGNWTPKPGMKAENYQMIVQPGRFIDGFLEQMIGMKVGEEKSLEVTFPKGYHDPDLDEKPAKFKVKIHTIKTAEKPALNDELAKKVGLETFEELNKRVEDEINKVHEANKFHFATDALMKVLLEKSEVGVSKSMIQRELDHVLAQTQRQKSWSDQELQDYIATLNVEEEEAEAAQKLKRSVLLTSVVKAEKLEASAEEIQKEFSKYNFPPNYDMSNMNVNAVVGQLNLDIVTRKAIEHLLSQAKVNYVEVDECEIEGHVHGPDCNHHHH